jgi:prepilin-type N-terminal cleavage/methylation domain-containing protein
MARSGRASRSAPRGRTAGARSAFTLIELLVVVAVMGLMMMIVVPRFRVSPKMYARNTARQLMRDAELVRNRALAAKQITRIQFTTGTNQYVSYGDDNADGVIAGTTAEVVYLHAFGTRQLSDGVIFGRGSAATGIPGETGAGAVTFASTRIDFDSRGIPSPLGTKGTVYFTTSSDASSVFAVQMSAAGGFRLWEYLNGTWQ